MQADEARNSSDDRTHRSVYLPIDREKIPESLDLFGFPDPNITSPGRPESIVPTQALYLMNGDFVTAQAQSNGVRDPEAIRQHE